MNRQYTETNLDELHPSPSSPAVEAKTSTPTAPASRLVNRYYTLQARRPGQNPDHLVPPDRNNQEKVATIRQTYEITVPPPPISSQSSNYQSIYGTIGQPDRQPTYGHQNYQAHQSYQQANTPGIQ